MRFFVHQEARDVKVVDAKIFGTNHGTGVAVLTSTKRIYLVYNVNEPKLRRLADIPGVESVGKSFNVPSAWEVYSKDHSTHVIVAVDRDLYSLEMSGATPLYPDLSGCNGSVVSIAVSSDGTRGLKTFFVSLKLCVTYRFGSIKYTTPALRQQPIRDNVLIVVGLNRDSFSLNFDLFGVHLAVEMDCVRIYTPASHEILQQVPKDTVKAFRIGSMSPGAILIEASKEFENHSHKADDYMRMIRDNLDVAVEECLQVANYEWKIDMQKMLLCPHSIGASAKPFIFLFTPSGREIGVIKWNSGPILEMGWSDTEDLIVVQEDGQVLLYDYLGNYRRTFAMGQEARDVKVVDAKIFGTNHGTGVAVLTSTKRIYLVYNVNEPKLRRLADIPGVESVGKSFNVPSAWEVYSKDHSTHVIVAVDRDLYSLEMSGATPLILAAAMAVSLASQSRRTERVISCGVAAMPSLAILEMDCVRIYTPASHEILQQVPKDTVKAFRIGSMSPGAILIEASKEFELYVFYNERAAKLGLSFIDGRDPKDFVNACQTIRLLNALRDPKIAMPLTYEQYITQGLKVVLDRLVLRRHHLLAIRIAQFLLSKRGWFSPLNAVDPLAGGRYPEADEAVGRILVNWAVYKIKQTHLDAEEIARSIARKLDLSPCISYADIADKALDCGKKPLAIKLLKLEVSAARAVPLLLKLDEDEEALKQSVASGDTDLVYIVLLRLLDKRQLGDFQMMIRSYPVAQSLYLKYCGLVSIEKLRDMYEQEDNFVGQAICRIKESYRSQRSDGKLAVLMSAVDQFKHAANRAGAVAPSSVTTSSSLGGGIEWSQSHMKHWATLTQEQVTLLKHQISLEEVLGNRTGVDFLHDSLTETLLKLLKLNELKLAEKLRLEFKVSDDKFFWLRLSSHAEKNEWFEIDKLARMKKHPGGFEAFVKVCLVHKNFSEAKRYAEQVKDDLKVKYYVKAGMLEEAAQLAMERKDIVGLDFVASKCVKPAHRELATRVQRMQETLGAR
ncbi:unnamed protein product [Notodromas monacha]|uniref:Vacuolar protein sorting-associated protein 16 homolog n=1 Tax=Notodromas monacha TaxID=399045 RepID=A0A7R9BBT5_9CRUS|nr:unnamed protein product [Notodromas monacha]CAG0912360.1 unnamed protein product [Notodromas monacha]